MMFETNSSSIYGVQGFDNDAYILAGKNIANYLPLGLPPDPVSSLPPQGLQGVMYSQPSSPMISSLQGVWENITTFSESAIKNVYKTTKGAVKEVYDDGKQLVGDAYDSVSNPVGSFLDNVYWKVILAVVVIGGVVYFAGKSGAVRVSR